MSDEEQAIRKQDAMLSQS